MDDLLTLYYIDFCRSICIMGYHGNGQVIKAHTNLVSVVLEKKAQLITSASDLKMKQ